MKYFSFILFMLFFTSCKQTIKGDLLIENVNIIDVENGKVIIGQDVVITGNKITDITTHRKNNIQTTAVINGENKYLMPGLWDMHIHILAHEWYKWQLPLLRANGIIGFREMWGNLKLADSIKTEMQKGTLPYFHFIASGHILDGKKPFQENSTPVATPQAAIRIVDSLINAKSDFIKVYSFLEPDVFYAIAKRCKERNFPFAGHVPHTVWLTGASEAGMASMEHLYGFLMEACESSDSALFLMQQSEKAFENGNKEERKKIWIKFHALTLNHFSEAKLRSIAQVLRKNNTYIVPTLVTLRGGYFTNDTSFINDPRLKYMSQETRDYWKEETENDLKKNSELEWQNKRQRWQVEQRIIKILSEEKVSIMAGTDSDNPYAFPGFSLHDEMALYVEFGMKPIDALRTATINPVKFLKMTDSLGTIEKGKLADVVLLDVNPLENIKNTTRINTVIANGKVYSKRYIDSVLKK